MSNQKTQDKAKGFLKEMDGLLKRHKLAIRLIVNFSTKKRTPLLSRIALWVVSKQGGRLDMQFGDLVKK